MGFLSEEVFAHGPWDYFEKAIARYLVHKGWENAEVIVKGKLGELTKTFNYDIQIEINEKDVVVTRKSDEKIQRELHGLTRVLIANVKDCI